MKVFSRKNHELFEKSIRKGWDFLSKKEIKKIKRLLDVQDSALSHFRMNLHKNLKVNIKIARKLKNGDKLRESEKYIIYRMFKRVTPLGL